MPQLAVCRPTSLSGLHTNTYSYILAGVVMLKPSCPLLKSLSMKISPVNPVRDLEVSTYIAIFSHRHPIYLGFLGKGSCFHKLIESSSQGRY